MLPFYFFFCLFCHNIYQAKNIKCPDNNLVIYLKFSLTHKNCVFFFLLQVYEISTDVSRSQLQTTRESQRLHASVWVQNSR